MGGMTSALLQQWMAHPEALDRGTLDELRGVLAQYPYFQSAWLLYLKNLYDLHDEGFGAELHKAVPYVADRAVLFQLTEGEHYAMQLRVEPEPAASAEETYTVNTEPVDVELTAEQQLELDMKVPCPITRYAGKTLGDVFYTDAKAINWLATKFTGDPKVKEAATRICLNSSFAFDKSGLAGILVISFGIVAAISVHLLSA